MAPCGRGGALVKGEKDERGRATLALSGVLGLIRESTGVAFSVEDVQVLLRADAGDADAQADIGALLVMAGAREAALHWLNEAARQGSAEAMQWLGTVCAAAGDERGNNEAIMWVAKAAALGHPIAQRQMDGLLGAALPRQAGSSPHMPA